MKLSPGGDIEWSQTLGGYEHDWANSVFLLDDGGIIVAGSYGETNNDLRYSMIVELDAEGSLA